MADAPPNPFSENRTNSVYLSGVSGAMFTTSKYLMDRSNEFVCEPDLKCNQLDAINVITTLICVGACSEDFDSISDTHPREMMCSRLEELALTCRSSKEFECRIVEELSFDIGIDSDDTWGAAASSLIKETILTEGNQITWTNTHLYMDDLKRLLRVRLGLHE